MDNLAVVEPAGKAGPVGVRARHPFEVAVAVSLDPRFDRQPLTNRLATRLAGHAGSAGRCWRSVAKLAEEMRADPQALREAARKLEAAGYLAITPGRYPGVLVFTFALDPGDPPPAKRPATAGQGASRPPVTSKEPVREPGHCYAGSLPTGEGDRILREAVVAAVAARDRQSITAAGLAIADALEGHTRFAPAYWKRLWDARRAGDPGPVLAGLDRAFAARSGRAFLEDPAQGGSSGPRRPKPAQGRPPNHPEIPDSSAPSFREVWARFRR